MRTRRLGLALLASLALHALLWAWLRVPAGAPSADPVPSEPIELFEVEPPAPSTSATAAPMPPVAPERSTRRRPAASQVRTTAPAPSEPPQPRDRPDAPPAQGITPNLLPPPLALLPSGSGPAFSGHTYRPGDGSSFDDAGTVAEQGERARQTLQGMAEDDLADNRARNGLIDPYFAAEERALQDKTEHAPKFTEGKTFIHDFLAAIAPGAAKYAQTGNPYAPGATSEEIPETEMTSPLSRAMTEQPGSQMAELGRKVAAGARMREFADGKFGVGITALVEIRQDASGHFLSATVLKSSGSRVFDQHVLARAPEAVATLPPAPAQGAGLHPTGLRSVWSFEGRILYYRKIKVSTLKPEDVAKMVGMGLISALSQGYVPQSTGRFDAQSGTLEVVDLTDPQFTCRVKLVRAY